MIATILLTICILTCSCNTITPFIYDGTVVRCSEAEFKLSLLGESAEVDIIKPETLAGMHISFGEKILCNYKGLETVLPQTACEIPFDAQRAARLINTSAPVSRSEGENGDIIFTYSLDETRLLVYYDSQKHSVIGFFVGDRYYEIVTEN